MGVFNRLKSGYNGFINPSSYRGPRKVGGDWFYPMGMGKDITEIDKIVAFNIPEVNAILNKRASAHSNIKIQVVNKKTLEPVENNLSALMKNPNWFQSMREFISQANLFHDLYGNEYDYMMFGVGIDPERSKGLYTLDPAHMDIEYKSENRFFQETETPEIKYIFKLGDKELIIPQEQIIHTNDNRVEITAQNGELLKGSSKLDALAAPLNNIIAAYDARGMLIRNRGALGILSNDSKDGIGSTVALDDTEKQNLQNEYKNYGITDNQWNVIITNMSLKWQKMGVDIASLKLFEEVREDTIKIADSFNLPYELLGSEKGVTFANKKEAEKNWYQDSIIPEAQIRIDALNAGFKTENKPYTIIGTFDHLPILQSDIKDRLASFTLATNALSKAYADQAITLDQYQSELMRYGFIEE